MQPLVCTSQNWVLDCRLRGNDGRRPRCPVFLRVSAQHQLDRRIQPSSSDLFDLFVQIFCFSITWGGEKCKPSRPEFEQPCRQCCATDNDARAKQHPGGHGFAQKQHTVGDGKNRHQKGDGEGPRRP